MLKVYGTPMCPDCRECKANFDHHGVAYENVDICESLRAMKEFLALRRLRHPGLGGLPRGPGPARGVQGKRPGLLAGREKLLKHSMTYEG